jgi:hypothetical protein
MLASVAILEDVANVWWGKVVGTPEESLAFAHTWTQMSHAQPEERDEYCDQLHSSQYQTMGEDDHKVSLVASGLKQQITTRDAEETLPRELFTYS